MRTQRSFMIEMWKKCNESIPLIVEKYAHAERVGIVNRKKNINSINAEKYAEALIRDGLKKGWLFVNFLASREYKLMFICVP